MKAKPNWRALLLATCVLQAADVRACWEDVGVKYGINPYLLYAIAKTESGLNPRAVNRANRNGSYDVGLMQINSSWFPTLARFGITERELYEPCVAIDVGAWILSQNMSRLGRTWDAVGAYNAADETRRLNYARKVFRNLPEGLRPGAGPCRLRPVPATKKQASVQPTARIAPCD